LPNINTQEFTERLRESLQYSELRANKLRKNNNNLMLSTIIASGLSTLVAGWTSAMGPVVGEGIAGWRISCIAAAILAFAATVLVSLSQQLRFSDKLAVSEQCVGRLKSLEISCMTGSKNWNEIAWEFAEILRSYPDAVR
jgi:hypothetical protein